MRGVLTAAASFALVAALAGQSPEDKFGAKAEGGAMTVIRYGVPRQE